MRESSGGESTCGGGMGEEMKHKIETSSEEMRGIGKEGNGEVKEGKGWEWKERRKTSKIELGMERKKEKREKKKQNEECPHNLILSVLNVSCFMYHAMYVDCLLAFLILIV